MKLTLMHSWKINAPNLSRISTTC